MLGHILERAIATIAIKDTGRRRESVWRAIRMPVAAANLVVIGVPVHIAGDEQVELSIVVVIEEARGDGPASARHAGFGGYIRKRSISVVVIQNVFAVAGHIQIRIPIVVVVADRHSHPVIPIPRAGQSRRLGYVQKAPVAVLAIQAVPVARIAPLEVFWNMQALGDPPAVDEKNIQQSIIVVVEQCNAARHGLNQEFPGGGGILQQKIDAAQRFYFEDRRRGGHRRVIQKITARKSAIHLLECLLRLATARRSSAQSILECANRLTRSWGEGCPAVGKRSSRDQTLLKKGTAREECLLSIPPGRSRG